MNKRTIGESNCSRIANENEFQRFRALISSNINAEVTGFSSEKIEMLDGKADLDDVST
jgi:hypothetical protein